MDKTSATTGHIGHSIGNITFTGFESAAEVDQALAATRAMLRGDIDASITITGTSSVSDVGNSIGNIDFSKPNKKKEAPAPTSATVAARTAARQPVASVVSSPPVDMDNGPPLLEVNGKRYALEELHDAEWCDLIDDGLAARTCSTTIWVVLPANHIVQRRGAWTSELRVAYDEADCECKHQLDPRAHTHGYTVFPADKPLARRRIVRFMDVCAETDDRTAQIAFLNNAALREKLVLLPRKFVMAKLLQHFGANSTKVSAPEIVDAVGPLVTVAALGVAAAATVAQGDDGPALLEINDHKYALEKLRPGEWCDLVDGVEAPRRHGMAALDQCLTIVRKVDAPEIVDAAPAPSAASAAATAAPSAPTTEPPSLEINGVRYLLEQLKYGQYCELEDGLAAVTEYNVVVVLPANHVMQQRGTWTKTLHILCDTGDWAYHGRAHPYPNNYDYFVCRAGADNCMSVRSAGLFDEKVLRSVDESLAVKAYNAAIRRRLVGDQCDRLFAMRNSTVFATVKVEAPRAKLKLLFC